MVFPFKDKGFTRKSLCFSVVVLLLCLLKFIHSNIEFFPTSWNLIVFFFFIFAQVLVNSKLIPTSF